jgi:hypothetical protein
VKIAGLSVVREPQKLLLRSEADSGVLVKAVLFVGLAMVSLAFLAGVSVFAGSAGGDPLKPRSNHVGFLWLVTSGVMLVVLPLYLSQIYKPATALELYGADQTVRSNGSIITRFEKIEYLEVAESRDSDGRHQYALTVLWGDGNKLLVQRSYDERELLMLADEISLFTEKPVRNVPSTILT